MQELISLKKKKKLRNGVGRWFPFVDILIIVQ